MADKREQGEGARKPENLEGGVEEDPLASFHAHLDACAHCHDFLFDLCPEGVRQAGRAFRAARAGEKAEEMTRLGATRRRFEEREASACRAQGQHDETCLRCARIIPHGEPFVPVVRNTTGQQVANPQFIGRQPVFFYVVPVPAGAFCVACVASPGAVPSVAAPVVT